jgi:hypothetical protein
MGGQGTSSFQKDFEKFVKGMKDGWTLCKLPVPGALHTRIYCLLTGSLRNKHSISTMQVRMLVLREVK